MSIYTQQVRGDEYFLKFVKTIGILLLFALLALPAAAITENKDLPTQTQILDFIDSVQDPSVTSLSETAMSENPTWKWDTWKDTNGDNFISFYYVNPDSKNGYGSLYFDNSGNKLSIPCGKYELIKSYTGEVEETVKEEQEESEESEEIEEDKETITEEPEVEVKEEIEEDKEIEEEEQEDKEDSKEVNEEENEETEEVSSLSNEDKIASIIYYFNRENMNSDSLELCLRHYFMEE